MSRTKCALQVPTSLSGSGADASDGAGSPERGEAPGASCPDTCDGIVAVHLAAIATPGALMVRATYEYKDPQAPLRCPGPAWTVSPNVDIVPTHDPFVIALSRDESRSAVVVTARAPNGVGNALLVRLH